MPNVNSQQRILSTLSIDKEEKENDSKLIAIDTPNNDNDLKGSLIEDIPYINDPQAIANSSTRIVQFSTRIQQNVVEAFNFILAIEQAKTPLRKLHKNQLIQEIIMKYYYATLKDIESNKNIFRHDEIKEKQIKERGNQIVDALMRGEKVGN